MTPGTRHRPQEVSSGLAPSFGCCPGCPSCPPGIQDAETPMPANCDVNGEPPLRNEGGCAGEHTSRPYGDSPLSSLCLTLWKSYLFNCRTKLAKLLCLKCFGRMVLVNFSFCTAAHVSTVHLEKAVAPPQAIVSVPPRPQSCRHRRSIVLLICTRGPQASCNVMGQHGVETDGVSASWMG